MSDQQEEFMFRADQHFIHVFADMFKSGDVAKMGTTTFTIYTAIKTYANLKDGSAWPTNETISKACGLSIDTVKRSTKELVEMGYLQVIPRTGKSNLYTLREKVSIFDQEGAIQAIAMWDYVPGGVKATMADLRNVMMSGNFEGAKIVQIQNLHIQVNNITGDNAAPVGHVSVNAESFNRLPKATRDILLGI